jgi:hypothetical protein
LQSTFIFLSSSSFFAGRRKQKRETVAVQACGSSEEDGQDAAAKYL